MTTIIFEAKGLRRRAVVKFIGDLFEAKMALRIKGRWMFSACVRSATRAYAIKRAAEWVVEEPEQ